MKKLWTLLLAAALLVSAAIPAIAAQTSGAAATLRLEKTEGTATVKNASGRSVTQRDGMRLYSGYQISTKKASCAYISLDETKAVKLDASSTGEVAQSGKKLEVRLTAGRLFFNVTVPLRSDESLSIATSTMVTGIRGTSGWIEVVDRFTTRVSLLEGELTITCIDPLTGQERAVTLTGGQTATIVYHGLGQDGQTGIVPEDAAIQGLIESGVIRGEHIIHTGTGLTVEALQEEDVPGFVAVEVAEDPELQNKITATTDLDVEKIIDAAEERLDAEQAAAEEEDAAIQEALEDMEAEKVDPLFGAPEVPVISGGTITPVTPAAIPFTGGTATQLNNVLSTAGTTPVTVSGAVTGDGATVTVGQGQTLVLTNGAALQGGDTAYDISGTMTVEANAAVSNAAYISINSADSLEVYGTLTNSGNILVGNTAAGALRVHSGGRVVNSGDITLGGDNAGTLLVYSGGAVEDSGLIWVNHNGTVTNSGDITITGAGTLTNEGTMTSEGTLTNSGVLVPGTMEGTVTGEGIQPSSPEYTITFEPNGGEGTVMTTNYNYGVSGELSINPFTREGYTFTGWNTEPDGSGTAYEANGSVKNLGDCTLYAQWTLNTYTVTFDANGGEGTMETQTFTYGAEQALSANAFTREGYTFSGWNTAAGGSGTPYTDEEAITLTESVTLYAQWTPIESGGEDATA